MGDDKQVDFKSYLKKDLGLRPKNIGLYEMAFRHRSYSYEQGMAVHESNERLEFLGDSVLGLALAEYLCARYSTSEEGDISKMKAQLGSRTTLAEVAKRIRLADYLKVGRGESKAGTQNLPSLMSNVFEAITGAIYLDRGWEDARDFVVRNFAPEFEKDLVSKDYKSVLQEFSQRKFRYAPFYQVMRTYGPEHHKTFEVLVRINGRVYGRGRGNTKKEGEQSAARGALRRFGELRDETPQERHQAEFAEKSVSRSKRRWFWPFGG